MIFIKTEITADGKELVTYRHNMPFDVQLGLGKTQEELEQEGVLLDSIPEPEQISGKNHVMYFNRSSNTVYYEYVDIPKTNEELLQEQLNALQEDAKTADQKYKELDLTTATFVEVKAAKIAQLEEACDNAIVNGFDYTINNVSYRFSCSLSAQANFQGTDTLFKDGLITEAEWTVTNNGTGAIERIIIDQTMFNSLKIQVFQHINSNISKLRNTLQPQVIAATTNSEVDAVVW